MVIKDFDECKKGYLVLDESVCQEYAGPYETLEGAENEDMIYEPKYIVKFEIVKEIK